jgi:hypothetical protein
MLTELSDYCISRVCDNEVKIVAAGHGYYGQHTPHELMNFTHRITELSFGKHYPGMINPLDKSYEFTASKFATLKYFINIVPTIYVNHASMNPLYWIFDELLTNQYAVTEYRTESENEHGGNTPGIFFKVCVACLMVSMRLNRLELG